MKKRNRSKHQLNWESSMKLLFAGLLGFGVAAYADIPVGIMGGESSDGSYAALITSADGSVTPISGVPTTGVSLISSVAINSSGLSLIGGRSDSAAYASFVSADGTLLPLTLSVSTGEIPNVALNDAGLGLIGGTDFSLNATYLAHVLSDGTVTPISFSLGNIEDVAMSNSGFGLVGGEGNDGFMYGAYVASNGDVTRITGTPEVDNGHIYATALNSAGNGIVGGRQVSSVYAAFVSPDGTVSTVLDTSSNGQLSSVAINNQGKALIGGQDFSSQVYAAYAQANGDVTVLFDSPFNGAINSVALNDEGVGLIGGNNGPNFYAAFVHPDGRMTSIHWDLFPAGEINSVAINNEGVGLVGGTSIDPSGYVALVAPNGTLTELTLTDATGINSVALIMGDAILDQATPKSAGPFGSIAYAQLAAASALENRLTQQNRLWTKKRKGMSPANVADNQGDVAYNEEDLVSLGRALAVSPKTQSTVRGTTPTYKPNSFWVEPFGDFVYLKEQGSIPRYSNEVGGVLVGYDRQGDNFIVGATAGYAFNYVQYSQGIGHAKVQEEMGSLYGSYYTDHFWFALALWGGWYQTKNTRHTLAQITSTGKAHGWIVEPHLELASPWAIDNGGLYYVEPFAQFDWVNNWQHHYTETGASGLNLQVPNIYNSLLQSEIGLRFYERFVYGWGDFCFEQKVSYVNQAPFDVNPATTSFVGSAATFPVAVASSQVQNLAAVQILGCFVPANTSIPYGGFSFQTTAGSSYQSYFVSLFSGIDF